jgi:hypothetical protein
MLADVPAGDGTPGEAWVGEAPTSKEIAALLTVGTVGMMITGVQPVVFGAFVAEGRLSTAQLGLATTAEFLAIGFAVLVAGSALRPRRLRFYGVAAGLVVLAADLLATLCSGTVIIADRAVAGIAEGLLVWLPACMIARSHRAAFWAAIFITIQTFAQLVYAALVSLFVVGTLGANGAVMSLALTGAVALVAALFMPQRFSELVRPVSASARGGLLGSAGAISLAGAIALGALFFAAAYQIGLYAYLEPLAAGAGLDAKVLGIAVSMSLAGQVCGSTLAALVSRRVRHFAVLVLWTLLNLILLAVFSAQPSAVLFILACTAFGFIWLFFMPFQVSLVIDADPTRRAAQLLPSAQLLGGAAGPFLCSLAVSRQGVGGILLVCGACLLAAAGPLILRRCTAQPAVEQS